MLGCLTSLSFRTNGRALRLSRGVQGGSAPPIEWQLSATSSSVGRTAKVGLPPRFGDSLARPERRV